MRGRSGAITRDRYRHQQSGDDVCQPGQVRRSRAALQRRPPDDEKAYGGDHPDVAHTLNNLALVYTAQGKYAQRRRLYQRALAIREKAFGGDHPTVADTVNNLALLETARGQTPAALVWSRRASAAVIAHAANRTARARAAKRRRGRPRRAACGLFPHPPRQPRWRPPERHRARPALGREALEIAQWANQSSAAAALQQMGLRFASGGGALGSTGARKPGPCRGVARAGQDADRCLVKPEVQQNRAAIETHAQADRRDRKQARRDCRAAREGISRIRRAGEPEAAQGRGGAATARRRRGAGVLAGRRQGELRLCLDARGLRVEDRSARGGGAGAEGGGFSPRPRCRSGDAGRSTAAASRSCSISALRTNSTARCSARSRR